MLLALVIAGIGVAVLLLGLLAGSLLDGLADALHTGDAGGPLTTEAIGGTLAAGGAAAALALSAGAPAGLAAAAGVAVGLPSGWLATRATRALAGMATDPTPRTEDLLGREATVVTPIRADGLGEVVVVQAGQRVKLSARSASPQPAGERVWVSGVESATCVLVTATGA